MADENSYSAWFYAWLVLSLFLLGFFLTNIVYFARINRNQSTCNLFKPGAIKSMLIVNSIGLVVILLFWIIWLSIEITKRRRERTVEDAGIQRQEIEVQSPMSAPEQRMRRRAMAAHQQMQYIPPPPNPINQQYVPVPPPSIAKTIYYPARADVDDTLY
jgi:type VI protein secretion system component VasK